MKTSSERYAERYLVSLRTFLADDQTSKAGRAGQLGRQAVRLGMGTVELANVHEQALLAVISPVHTEEDGSATILRAGTFFRDVLTPVAATQSSAADRRLQRETARRVKAESALKESRREFNALLKQSRLQQSQLRRLTHQILLAQEEERKMISRELHDEISQILTGINMHLAALTVEATKNTGNLKRKISTAQRLVEKSVAVVHRFARDLRPAMLDDLGIVPALLAFLKEVGNQSGLLIRFNTVTADRIDHLDGIRRTVLYRIAQEALTNIQKHAKATVVVVSLRLPDDGINLEISDNGTGFDVARALNPTGRERLGILGMRERVEIVGGTFHIESVAGTGTTIRAQLPLSNGKKGKSNTRRSRSRQTVIQPGNSQEDS